nr:hypothetical protein BaRGS_027922 [Batillaria attramentaria]
MRTQQVHLPQVQIPDSPQGSTDDDRTRVERMEEEKFAYSQAFETVSEFYSSDNVKSKFLHLPAACLRNLEVFQNSTDRENDKANLFVDIERYPEVASVKHEISNVLQEIKDYRREIRLALRQPALDYVTVNQVEFLVEVKNTQLRTVPSDWMQISRPEVTEDAVMIEIEDGRHPVIDALKGEHEQYVPNSTLLTSEGQHVMIVTGPNMGGKSSYIRQVALIAVMAQIGSFVPAASARLGILDAIFTRLVRCLSLFVTHYPMLAEFQQSFPDTVGNFHMAFLLYDGSDDEKTDNTKEDGSMETEDDGTAKDDGNEEFLTFLYQLTPGAAAKSYGLNVARLAQIPREVLRVAATMSHQLEEKISQRS